MAPDNVEHTRWSPGLIGFYLSCAGTAMGSTIAASGWFFFGSKGAIFLGVILAVVSIVCCFISLHAARKQPGNGAS